ncbi:MAG: hypothetical protein Unbinned6224contig1001_37 [Prokaryotic dsDNA virus sp.]|nr:MAG: hypothetical protein Unbinned6224contig1001_37 [Prokaryotic dsDNA virus sp.]|tara:strand:- start:17501 stop:18589 length:1089 start_codon:yes stop_codon:yes gene_type:complete
MATYSEILTTASSNKIGADLLNVSGNGSDGQVLKSDGDGTFSWVGNPSANNTTITLAGGDGMSPTAGDFTTNQASAETITLTMKLQNLTEISNAGIDSDDTIPFHDDGVGNRKIKYGDLITRMAGRGLSQDSTNAYQLSMDTTLPNTVTGCAGAWTSTAGNITASDGNVIVTGADHQVTTPKISVTTINGYGAGSGHAVTITPTEFQIQTDLKVGGNDIKSSDGTTAISLSSADVTVAGGLTVSGDLTVTGANITTSAEVLKINDNTMVLNAEHSSAGVSAGIVVERGSTGDNSVLYWNETADAWYVGTNADADLGGNLSAGSPIMLNVSKTGGAPGSSDTEAPVGGLVYDSDNGDIYLRTA